MLRRVCVALFVRLQQVSKEIGREIMSKRDVSLEKDVINTLSSQKENEIVKEFSEQRQLVHIKMKDYQHF